MLKRFAVIANKLKPSQDITMGILGLILASIGTVILMGNTPASVTHGQTGQPYASTWTAQKVITVCCWGSQNVAIGIGVSEWTVNGTIEGTPAFQETWKAPEVSSIFLSVGDPAIRVFDKDPRESTFSPSKWLLGAVVKSPSTILTFREATIADLRRDWKVTRHKNQAGGNGGVACDGSDLDCRFTSGAYGWTDGESLGASRGSSQPVGGGIFMPLEWTVSGTIFD